jgi:membrane glycosyltransferase
MSEPTPSSTAIDLVDAPSMIEPAGSIAAIDLADASLTTPGGTQSMASLRLRRRLVLAMNAATDVVLAVWMAGILGAGGWTAVDVVLFACFVVATPWMVLGFWNAALGLWVLHGCKDGFAQVAPYAEAGDRRCPPRARTAVVMTLRNEDPVRALARLRAVKKSVDATGFGERFSYFVLSDTAAPEIAAAEETIVAAWRREVADPDRIVYRRRAHNTGFKAGNLRDFCESHGRDYQFMLPLDADSLMSGDAIVRLVRIMQAYPRIGILQSLPVGAPSEIAFARIFQFGMRHGMRAYTMGSAWWVGDCGPFWGHNALVRIAPFAEHCRLPLLPGGPPLGGHLLSHDQIEAALMRRAGYEVRVVPDERGSWEENPPTVFEFSARDLRWCQGNLQYCKLLGLPRLHLLSRFQLAWAILMFAAAPAITLMIALAPFKVAEAEADFPALAAVGLYLAVLAMHLSPKLAGLADVLLTRGGVGRHGGPRRFLAGAAIEIPFSFLLGAVTAFRIALFMVGLTFGRTVTWNGQARQAHGVSWATALRGLWPPFLFGLAICGTLLFLSPATLLWSLPLTLGYILAVPFAVVTASPALGAFLKRRKLCAVPEEDDMPREFRALSEAFRVHPRIRALDRAA